jgi:hypothetical protein
MKTDFADLLITEWKAGEELHTLYDEARKLASKYRAEIAPFLRSIRGSSRAEEAPYFKVSGNDRSFQVAWDICHFRDLSFTTTARERVWHKTLRSKLGCLHFWSNEAIWHIIDETEQKADRIRRKAKALRQVREEIQRSLASFNRLSNRIENEVKILFGELPDFGRQRISGQV